jgi:hypothetical protein
MRLLLPLLLLFASCQQQSEASFQKSSAPESAPQQYAADELGTEPLSSAAARPGAIDSLKKFIRTANMRFQVKNVARATIEAENTVLRQGGFVIQSNLNSNIESQKTTPISQDSALQTTRFITECQLVLRVPYTQLDTTLRAIGKLADFLQYRHVQAEDVSLQLLEKELIRLREGLYQHELDQSPESKNTPKPERARDSRAANDQARLEALKLQDQIQYSTIRVELYEQPRMMQSIVANTSVTPPLTLRLRQSLASGGELVLTLLVGIVQFWGVLLIAGIVFLLWKFVAKKIRGKRA